MTSIQQGKVFLWLTRIMFAVVIGVGLNALVTSETLLEYFGYSLAMVFVGGITLLWMRVLEELIEEEERKTPLDMDDLSP